MYSYQMYIILIYITIYVYIILCKYLFIYLHNIIQFRIFNGKWFLLIDWLSSLYISELNSVIDSSYFKIIINF